jgi:hypothetical protein
MIGLKSIIFKDQYLTKLYYRVLLTTQNIRVALKKERTAPEHELYSPKYSYIPATTAKARSITLLPP